MRCIKLTVSYCGTAYGGWQVQPNAPTVQAHLESAIESVTGVAAHATASGRTDSGVHAIGQVASFHTESKLPIETLQRALNANLPTDIRIVHAAEANENFHPIRDAIRKRYQYRIVDGPIHDVFRLATSWHVPQRLDVEAMSLACRQFIGEHDFAAFQASGSDRKTTVRNIMACELTVVGDNEQLEAHEKTSAEEFNPQQISDSPREIRIEVEANGFLYNMVRNIVGSLVEVGRGKKNPDWISQVIASCDRRQAGPTAPPQGLFLLHVTYPSTILKA